MRDDIHIFVQSNVCARSTEFFIQHNRAWVQSFEYVQIEEDTIPPVAMCLSNIRVQDLMDKLWSIGFRPTEGSGSAGALAATERHLKDMQRLVFDPAYYV
jgi:hypothetical protein